MTPVKDPWLSLGSDCGGLGWTGPRRPLKSLESLSSGQELGLTRFRVGSEEDCPQESWAPEGQSKSAVKPQLVLLVSVQSHMTGHVCCTRTTEQKHSSLQAEFIVFNAQQHLATVWPRPPTTTRTYNTCS